MAMSDARAREGGKRTGLTRIMDRQREAAWKSALAKMERGEEVPSEEHFALLREGLFEGMDKVASELLKKRLRMSCSTCCMELTCILSRGAVR